MRRQLYFMSQLRLPQPIDNSMKEHLVCRLLARMSSIADVLLDQIEQTLDAVGLTHCANTAISKLSAGEKKRLGIACELIASPRVLLLDEPTSGGCLITCAVHIALH